MNLLKEFMKDDAGVTAIEYGLIATLIAVAIVASVSSVGTQLNTTFTTIKNKLTVATS